MIKHQHNYRWKAYCGLVCSICEDHKGLTKCDCGWKKGDKSINDCSLWRDG